MEICEFKAEHIFQLRLQAAQARFAETFTLEYARALAATDHAYTALVEGRPIACSGLVEQWPGRALAWALLDGEMGAGAFVRVSRAVRRFLDATTYARIEMQVDADHAAAIRWAELLGFEIEGRRAKFLPDGRDAFEYVRIR